MMQRVTTYRERTQRLPKEANRHAKQMGGGVVASLPRLNLPKRGKSGHFHDSRLVRVRCGGANLARFPTHQALHSEWDFDVRMENDWADCFVEPRGEAGVSVTPTASSRVSAALRQRAAVANSLPLSPP